MMGCDEPVTTASSEQADCQGEAPLGLTVHLNICSVSLSLHIAMRVKALILAPRDEEALLWFAS